MLVEVIVQNAEDAIQAERFGADRLELVSAMSEGGLTPSYGAIKGVLNSTKLPVQIMIRPHSYGFQYNEADWEIMKEDISMIQQLGGTGIVIGGLTAEGMIDERCLSVLSSWLRNWTLPFIVHLTKLVAKIRHIEH